MNNEMLPMRQIPEIKDTLERIYEQSQAVLSDDEVELNKKYISSYEILLRDAQGIIKNEFSEWGDISMTRYYLKNRKSLSFYSNYSFLCKDDIYKQNTSLRAASLIYASVNFFDREKEGKLEPDFIKGIPVGMEQYKRLFCASRIPGISIDSIKHANSNNVVVACNGTFYSIDFKTNKNRPDLNAIFNTLNAIENDAYMNPDKNSIAVLTCGERTKWAINRELIIKSKINLESISEIERSVLFVSIEKEENPATSSEKFKHVHHGKPKNRWFDKTHMLIVTNSGSSGACFDHTCVDGFPASRYLNEICQVASTVKLDNIDSKDILSFKRLEWEFNDEIENAIEEGTIYYDVEFYNRDIRAVQLKIPSHSLLKSNGITLDAFIQIGFQLGLRKYANYFLTANEAVLLQHYKNDRYDTAFTVTKESKLFIDKFIEKTNRDELKKLFSRASEAHKNRIKETKEGKGPIFHLTSLVDAQPDIRIKLGYNGLEIDGKYICVDSSLKKVMDVDATTSNLSPRPFLNGFSFTDSTPNVIGLAYVPVIEDGIVNIALKTDYNWLGHAKHIELEFHKVFDALGELLK